MPLRIGKYGLSLPIELVTGGFAALVARLVELGFVELVRPGVVRGSEMLFHKGE